MGIIRYLLLVSFKVCGPQGFVSIFFWSCYSWSDKTLYLEDLHLRVSFKKQDQLQINRLSELQWPLLCLCFKEFTKRL